MKVMTVGVGKLGSQVAWHVLREFKPEKMLLVDIKNLDGDLLDLQHACEGMNIKTEILIKNDKRPYNHHGRLGSEQGNHYTRRTMGIKQTYSGQNNSRHQVQRESKS